MDIQRIPEWQLTPALETEIATLLTLAFGEAFGGRSYYQQRHHIRFIARENGTLLGHMALCFRDVRLGDDLIPICGLAEVATAPDARGKGIATALLEDAIAASRTTPATFLVLFGSRPIYAGHGFQKHRNRVTYLDLENACTGQVEAKPDDGLMVLALSEKPWDPTAALDLLGHKF